MAQQSQRAEQPQAARVLLESITERESRKEDAATNELFQLGYNACEELLADLDPSEAA